MLAERRLPLLTFLVVGLLVGLVGCRDTSDRVISGTGSAETIVGGDGHGCVIGSDGGVRCWGKNQFGQLGDGGTTDSPAVAVPALGVSSAESVAIGDGFACSVLGTGQVACWGVNPFGQMGNGTWMNAELTPVKVTGIDSAREVTAGVDHACAIIDAGAVRCWGDNEFGQLGDGSRERRLTPVDVKGITGAKSLSSGAGFTCAVLDSGKVVCWGINMLGQLGDGGGADSSTPRSADLPGRVEAIVSGRAWTCALTERGQVYCWGEGLSDRRSEDGGPGDISPSLVAGVSGGRGLVGGDDTACAVGPSRGLQCWVLGPRGRRAARKVSGVELRPIDNIGHGPVDIALVSDEICVIQRPRGVLCSPEF